MGKKFKFCACACPKCPLEGPLEGPIKCGVRLSAK